jgi:hypothetical protein
MKAVIVEIKGKYAAILAENGLVSKVRNRNYEIGQEIVLNNNKAKLIRMTAAAAAAIMIFVTPAWAYLTPYSYVSLDVNPSFEFFVNRFDRVLTVKAFNDDGGEMSKDIDIDGLKNKEIQTAVKSVLNELKNKGYINEGQKDGVIVAASSKSEKKTDILSKKIRAAVSEEVVPETNELEEEKETETEETEEEPDPNMIVSPLDGLRYYPEDLSKRPVALSIDNHPKARWQAGISQAEIVYEVEVEHPFTRYLCIFYAKEPERIGPVRSARPYLIYYALEYDGIFVHVGGSDDAFIEIKRLGVAEVDGLYSGALWRYYDTGKYAPHNVYTTLESIRKEAENYGYRTDFSFEGYSFNERDEKLSDNYEVNSAVKVNIIYNAYNTTDYLYDEDNNTYLRFKDEEEHIDEFA